LLLEVAPEKNQGKRNFSAIATDINDGAWKDEIKRKKELLIP